MSDILVAVRDVFLYKQRERQKMQARIEKWAHRPMGDEEQFANINGKCHRVIGQNQNKFARKKKRRVTEANTTNTRINVINKI